MGAPPQVDSAVMLGDCVIDTRRIENSESKKNRQLHCHWLQRNNKYQVDLVVGDFFFLFNGAGELCGNWIPAETKDNRKSSCRRRRRRRRRYKMCLALRSPSAPLSRGPSPFEY